MNGIISNGTIVSDGRAFEGSVIINNGYITDIIEGKTLPRGTYNNVIDATGCFVLPGVIDTHVHFRDPGLTSKADIESESRAAAYGGVTSFFDMPNTIPQTITLETFNEKRAIGSAKSHVNYSFFFGATNDNHSIFAELDPHRVPGIKLFMGSSTGGMLVDKYGSLLKIFETAAAERLLLMAHCEDTDIINTNMAAIQKAYGNDPDISLHPLIRSEEACFSSSSLAIQLAKTYNTHLHIAHLSTAKELDLLGLNPNITAEAVISHLYFTSKDYLTKGGLIKCNPSIKSFDDREALRLALTNGKITTVSTDHAPHLLSEKQGGCAKAASGMPMIQFSLVTMLELVDEGILPIERLVELMCHNPAKLFRVKERGYIRKNYKADITIVKPNTAWTVTENVIQSKCKWSPMMEHTYNWAVQHTLCNGHLVHNNGEFDSKYHGEEIYFE